MVYKWLVLPYLVRCSLIPVFANTPSGCFSSEKHFQSNTYCHVYHSPSEMIPFHAWAELFSQESALCCDGTTLQLLQEEHGVPPFSLALSYMWKWNRNVDFDAAEAVGSSVYTPLQEGAYGVLINIPNVNAQSSNQIKLFTWLWIITSTIFVILE